MQVSGRWYVLCASTYVLPTWVLYLGKQADRCLATGYPGAVYLPQTTHTFPARLPRYPGTPTCLPIQLPRYLLCSNSCTSRRGYVVVREGGADEGSREGDARPFPSSCIRPVSSTRPGRPTQRRAAEDMTGYDHSRKGECSTSRRDGMDGDGQGTAELFGSLAWALARQSNLVRLARLPAEAPPGRPANLAPSRCGSLLLLPSRPRPWSLIACFLRGTTCGLTRVRMGIDNEHNNSNSQCLSGPALPCPACPLSYRIASYRVVPHRPAPYSCRVVIRHRVESGREADLKTASKLYSSPLDCDLRHSSNRAGRP